MLGSLKSLYPPMEGVDKSDPGVNRDGNEKYVQKPKALFQLPYGVDPPHGPADVRDQIEIAGPCGGFVNNFLRQHPTRRAMAHQVMAYFDHEGTNRLPVLHTLAENFTICDHWFSSVGGPTWANRFYVHSGTSLGRVFMPAGFHHWHRYNQTTVFDRLNKRSVSWNIYFGDIPQSLTLSHQREAKNAARYRAMNLFYRDAKGPEKDFPQYAFIEPTYFGGYQDDQHPPANVLEGELLLAKVYNALRQNDALWRSTLLVILYDEHGGFYDHVEPGPAPAPDPRIDDGFTFTRYGLRVPALLISPYAPKGVVSSIFDHTSLLRYLSDKPGWNLGQLGKRVAAAKSFGQDLLAQPRTDTPARIELPDPEMTPLMVKSRKTATRAAGVASASTAQGGADQDFNDLQLTLLALSHRLESETSVSTQRRGQTSLRVAKSPNDQVAVAQERVKNFLEQQKAVARSSAK
jgi:phospholipase C